jgi:uncharacterized protein YjiK
VKVTKIVLTCFMFLIAVNCNKIKFGKDGEKLKPVKTFSLQIPEPSGTTFSNGILWVVSDENSTVYKINATGKKIYSFAVNGFDLEGITLVDDSLLAIVLERSREIVLTDSLGKEIARFSVDIKGEENSGLEGITYNPVNKHFYLINEKNPVLLLETDRNFKEISRKEISETKDLSGIYYSNKDDCLWLLSDEDRKIIKYSFEGKILAEYRINVEQPEGIAFSKNEGEIYIVSDKTEKLYVYTNPD